MNGLDTWDRLEASGAMAVSGSQLARESEQLSVISEREPDREVVEEAVRAEDEEPTPAAEKPLQATLNDFSVYRCLKCDMMMGFEKDKHAVEAHKGQKVEWKKLR